jgi:hypothetical protein
MTFLSFTFTRAAPPFLTVLEFCRVIPEYILLNLAGGTQSGMHSHGCRRPMRAARLSSKAFVISKMERLSTTKHISFSVHFPPFSVIF